jgi:hypothetical protein
VLRNVRNPGVLKIGTKFAAPTALRFEKFTRGIEWIAAGNGSGRNQNALPKNQIGATEIESLVKGLSLLVIVLYDECVVESQPIGWRPIDFHQPAVAAVSGL